MAGKRTHPARIVLLTLLFFFFCLILAPLIGSQSLDAHRVIQYVRGQENPDGVIFFHVRLPRVLLGALVGATLSLAGVVFQALLRNALATPYTLGVSSGGALGAVLAIKVGLPISLLGFTTVQVAAFSGSLLTVLLVYSIARRFGSLSIHIMILVGVTISYFFGAMILFLHYLADFTETHQMIRWMMGGLGMVSYGELIKLAPILIICYAVLWAQAHPLNIISTSEEIALSKGVSVKRVQLLVFVTASIITGMVVALAGPIGFVGLIVPHLLRFLTGPDHRYLIPASLFFGAGFLILTDTLARIILAPVDLPVGIITALLGGPFFLWLLIRRS